MLGNPVMVSTQRLTIVLLVLCITYVTQTAPLNISFPDFQNQFTKEISKSLKDVKWGCGKETKCYRMNKSVKILAEKEVKWGCAKRTKCYEMNKLLKLLAEKEVKWGCAKGTKCYEMNKLLKLLAEKEVKWGCAKGTKCYEMIILVKKLAESRGIEIKSFRKKKNGKSKRAKKQADDMLKEIVQYFKEFSQQGARSTKDFS